VPRAVVPEPLGDKDASALRRLFHREIIVWGEPQ